MPKTVTQGKGLTELTPFEIKVVMRVMDCAVNDKTLPLSTLAWTPAQAAALNRAYQKLRAYEISQNPA